MDRKTVVVAATVLIVAGLGADVALTLKGMPTPAIVVSIITAALGVLAPGLINPKGDGQ